MKSDTTKQARRVIGRVVVLLAMGAGSSMAHAQATMTDLVRVSQASGDDYKALRDDLLERHPEKWDVAAATAVSWEAGVTALALNARLAAPDDIKQWEAAPLRPMSASGKTPAFRTGDQKALRVWQLEQIWSADRHFGQDLSFYAKSPLADVPTALWQGIWANADNELLRKVAIHAMASSDDPGTHDTVAAVLSDPGSPPQLRAACLLGLRHRVAPDTTRLVLGSWEQLEESRGLEYALAVLVRQTDAAARERLAKIARDAKYPDLLRAEAVVVLGSNPQPGDGEVFAQFLASDAPIRAKKDALHRATRWTLDNLRPAVRYVLQNSTDRGLISEAMAALARCHLHADPMGTATDPETPEDIRLIDAAIERIGSPEGMQRSRDFCVRTIQGYRGPWVGDKWPWERHAPKP